MFFCDSEEEFLSIYTAFKLEYGGEPIIKKEELKSVLNRFMKSRYFSNNFECRLKKLNFDNLEKINCRFQQKASVNRSWLKSCFIYKDGNLFPTYDFFDFTHTTYGEFRGFLYDDINNIIFKDIKTYKPLNKKYLKEAKIVANHLTKVFAKRYIAKEIENGRWPVHLNNVSYLLEKDLAKTLELKRTKKDFINFYKYVTMKIADMLEENNGKLELSDKKYGSLKYNNLKRILLAYPDFDKMCSAYYDDNVSKFDIIIDVDKNLIKSNSTTLVDHDPYGNFSDVYSNEEIILK